MTTPFLVREDLVMAALREVFDPELGINVVDLGLVYGVEIEGDDILVRMTLTTPGCPLHDTLTQAVDEAVRYFNPSAGSVSVDLIWEPRWKPEMITPAGRRELGWR
ncbi:MAG TPA: metal-sulfur cluster assembly factor [Nitrolancea sp.]|nr:metal-sulfur cluster assembly factor [Nitrolancea sp.]